MRGSGPARPTTTLEPAAKGLIQNLRKAVVSRHCIALRPTEQKTSRPWRVRVNCDGRVFMDLFHRLAEAEDPSLAGGGRDLSHIQKTKISRFMAGRVKSAAT
jgi:hypothetical protein